jgi:hypothetical protein
MSMNINDLSFDQLVPSESKYLSKGDVGEDGLILTIKGFRMETVKGDESDEDKIVMHFREDMKPMIINRTNAQLLAMATGVNKTGDAVGKQVVVYNDVTVSFGGKVTGGLRIKKVSGAPKRAAPAAADLNDDVPW